MARTLENQIEFKRVVPVDCRRPIEHVNSTCYLTFFNFPDEQVWCLNRKSTEFINSVGGLRTKESRSKPK